MARGSAVFREQMADLTWIEKGGAGGLTFSPHCTVQRSTQVFVHVRKENPSRTRTLRRELSHIQGKVLHAPSSCFSLTAVFHPECSEAHLPISITTSPIHAEDFSAAMNYSALYHTYTKAYD